MQKLTKPVPGSFNDQAHIYTYLSSGTFPKIHDAMGSVVAEHANEHEPCFDIGACIGMMALRNVTLGNRSFCLGIEGNASDFARAVPHERVRYSNYYIAKLSMARLERDLMKHKPTLVTARRVISELGLESPLFVEEFAETLHHYGVKKIVLQGRAFTPRPAVALYNTELEAERFLGYYEVAVKSGDVWMLVAK